MTTTMWKVLAATALIGCTHTAYADVPEAIAVHGQTRLASFHAQGAQVYECKTNASGVLAWQFREPIATLIENGQTVGRHYAGPSWELSDGSVITGKVAASSPGLTPNDIPLLKLDVTKRSGHGRIADVTTIQRVNTRGGVADGPCTAAGAFLSVPYAADYLFYR
jgi:hypothetical protein